MTVYLKHHNLRGRDIDKRGALDHMVVESVSLEVLFELETVLYHIVFGGCGDFWLGHLQVDSARFWRAVVIDIVVTFRAPQDLVFC